MSILDCIVKHGLTLVSRKNEIVIIDPVREVTVVREISDKNEYKIPVVIRGMLKEMGYDVT